MSAALDGPFRRNADILYAPVGTEQGVMMSVEAGRYYGLNSVGARVWELLEHPKTIAELSAQICEEFEVDIETCEAEVSKFVSDMLANGIVHADPA